MKFQNLILDILRVLPKKIIQYIAGPPIIIDGNTLDPNMQIIAKLISEEQQKILDNLKLSSIPFMLFFKYQKQILKLSII